MDVLFLSRVQFAFTIMFHYLFPPLTIGMGVILVFLEARYLKTWLEAGLDSVKTPGNEDCLKAIVPKLESLKRKIDEIIAPYLDSIVNVKTKDRISRQLWMELTRGVRSE